MALVVVFGIVLLAGSVVRVPEGMLLSGAGSLRPAGLHFKRPFSSITLVPLSGRLEGIEIDRKTDEGATVRIRLSFDYNLDAGLLGAHADEVRSAGLRGMTARDTAAALEPLPLAALLPANPSEGNASLPRSATDAIDRALRASGIVPVHLVARIGPPSAFGDAG